MVKRILLLLLSIIFVPNSFSQNILKSTVDSVTIFPSGAQVFRSFKASLVKGENHFELRGISKEVPVSSIALNLFDSGLSVSNLTLQPMELGDAAYSDLEKEMHKKNEGIKKEIDALLMQKTLLKKQEYFLNENQKIGGLNTGLKTEDLVAAANYFKEEMQGIYTQLSFFDSKMDSLKREMQKNYAALNHLANEEERKLSVLKFTIFSGTSLLNHSIQLSYFTKNAGWDPEYDVKVESVSDPLSLVYKANVFQYSGENWENIVLTLNSLNPKLGATAPNLKPWIWGIVNTYEDDLSTSLGEEESAAFQMKTLQGKVVNKENQGLPGALVQIMGTSLGITTDLNGYYSLAIPLNMDKNKVIVQFSFVGYKTLEKSLTDIQLVETLEESPEMLQEVVVTGYAPQRKVNGMGANVELSGGSAGFDMPIGKGIVKRNLIVEEDAPTQSSFRLNQKVSLPSTGKTRTMELKETEVPASFTYVTVPKVYPTAFLQAELLDWESLKLLPGQANLYVEGKYVGKTSLDIGNSDTLLISLGRDESILVERKEVTTMRKKSFLSTFISQQKAYEISIRNTKNVPIRITIIDQYPLSSSKDITVTDKEAKGAKENSSTGELIWDLKIPPRNTQKVQLQYTVKYPKSEYIYE